MCGRYVSPETAAIERAFSISPGGDPFPRRFNVAPTMPVQIVRRLSDANGLEIAAARWGLVPGWWREAKPPSHGFNARSEEAATKPMWRYSLANARCILPAEGWYEWSDAPRTDPDTGEIRTARQPHFIFRPNREIVGMAGLMSLWYQSNDAAMLTCAVLTRAASPSVSNLHERMPVVLRPEQFDGWLDPTARGLEEALAIIARSETEFSHYRVTPLLNTAKDDNESFIKPWAPEPPAPPRQASLGIE